MATVDQLRKVGLRESWIVGTEDSVNDYLRRQIAIVNRHMAKGTVSGVTRKRLNARLANLNAELNGNFSRFNDDFTEEAFKLSKIDADTEVSTLALAAGTGVTIKTPTDRRILAANSTVVFTDYAKEASLSASQMASKLNKTNISTINNIIRDGYINGLTNEEITISIVGTRVRPVDGSTPYYTGGYTGNTHKRDVNSTVRTITRKMSENARESVWKENSDIITGIEFVATLDNRTTIICASFDGSVWKANDASRPIPPLHWGCRSTTVPVIRGNDVDPEDYRVAKEAKKATAKDGRSERVSAKKTRTARAEVPRGTSYDDFLRGNYIGGEPQPKWFVEDVFGKGRAELYLSNNGMRASDMLKDGEKILLDDLAKKYKRAERG